MNMIIVSNPTWWTFTNNILSLLQYISPSIEFKNWWVMGQHLMTHDPSDFRDPFDPFPALPWLFYWRTHNRSSTAHYRRQEIQIWSLKNLACFFTGSTFVGFSHSLSNTMWPGRAEVYFRTKWRLHPSSRFATTDMNRKLGAVPPLGGGELRRHLTQRRLGWGLPPYQVAFWSIQPFLHLENVWGPMDSSADSRCWKCGGTQPLNLKPS